MEYDFQLTFRDDETGELHVETYIVKNTVPTSIDFYFFAWDKAINYGFNFRGSTMLGICMVAQKDRKVE